MKRRLFLRTVGASTMAVLANGITTAARGGPGSTSTAAPPRYEKWLRARHGQVLTRNGVESFLRREPPANNQWAKFDPELGYVPKDSIQRDGIDGSLSVTTISGA